MESIKRKWGKPGLDVQVFTPEEYCHSCWLVLCNFRGYAFQDKNGSGTFDLETERVHSNQNHPDAELVILGNGKSPAMNCYASTSRHMKNIGSYYRPEYVPDESLYKSSDYIEAFWFKATRNGVEATSLSILTTLLQALIGHIRMQMVVKRPNHS